MQLLAYDATWNKNKLAKDQQEHETTRVVLSVTCEAMENQPNLAELLWTRVCARRLTSAYRTYINFWYKLEKNAEEQQYKDVEELRHGVA